jgi:hypothetical protein
MMGYSRDSFYWSASKSFLAPPDPNLAMVLVVHALSPHSEENLAPGERIVLDYYRHCGLVLRCAQPIDGDRL